LTGSRFRFDHWDPDNGPFSMSTFRTFLTGTIAILGMLAVLLGAMEHEDLIFQAEVSAEVTEHADQGSLGMNGIEDFSLTNDLHRSGTEGTFRSEVHRLWLLPRIESSHAMKRWLTPPTARAVDVAADDRLHGRSRLLGVVALRL